MKSNKTMKRVLAMALTAIMIVTGSGLAMAKAGGNGNAPGNSNGKGNKANVAAAVRNEAAQKALKDMKDFMSNGLSFNVKQVSEQALVLNFKQALKPEIPAFKITKEHFTVRVETGPFGKGPKTATGPAITPTVVVATSGAITFETYRNGNDVYLMFGEALPVGAKVFVTPKEYIFVSKIKNVNMATRWVTIHEDNTKPAVRKVYVKPNQELQVVFSEPVANPGLFSNLFTMKKGTTTATPSAISVSNDPLKTELSVKFASPLEAGIWRVEVAEGLMDQDGNLSKKFSKNVKIK